MNKVILMGRLTRDPEVRYSQAAEPLAIARYTLEKYLKHGTKIAITGRIQTGSYTNKDGNKVYTTEVVVEEQEFAESKNASGNNGGGYQQEDRPAPGNASADGFMDIPTGLTGNDLPFK